MQKETLIKQLIYRSNHRGCKETDILLGKFIREKIFKFSDEELQSYKLLIAEDDVLIYDWILGKEKVPEIYIELVKKIQEFHFKN